MRLINENGWKIAWSSMDIFAGMSSRARLSERADFPPRADIKDRHGKTLAEEAGEVYSLYVIKQDMPNVEDCLARLAEARCSRSAVCAGSSPIIWARRASTSPRWTRSGTRAIASG